MNYLISNTTKELTEIDSSLNINLASNSLFNKHEILGIVIAFIYFLIGFPSNLISIIVCCKSLSQNFFTKLTKNKIRRLNKKEFERNSFINTNKLLYGNLNLQKEKCVLPYEISQLNDNYLNQELDPLNNENTNNLRLKQNKSRQTALLKSYKFSNNEFLCKNSVSLINQNERQLSIGQQKPKTKIRNNPHCKCFELFLVEISFCDLIILSYNFTEWVLLILSRLKLIDSIYMEPVLISKFMCRFIIALNRTVILLHNWLVAFMAITRCYAIYKPFSSNLSFSSKFYFRLNLMVLVSLIVLFSIINTYGVLLLSYSKNSLIQNSNITMVHSYPECKISKEIYEKYRYIDVYINITLGVIGYSLPCFITLIINLLLIYNIRNLRELKSNIQETKSFDRTLSNNFNSSNSNSTTINYPITYPNFNNTNVVKKNRIYSTRSRSQFFKATSSLLTLSFSYLICYIPYSFLFLLLSLDKIKMNGDVIFAFTCLRYLNHTLNFYIYFATGKRFRNDVLQLLGINKKP